MTHSLERFLKEQDVKFYRSYSMKKISSIEIGGNTNLLALPDTNEKLISLLRFAYINGVKHKVVGRMTNILPCDSDYQGLLITNKNISGYFMAENGVVADCGVVLSKMIYEIAAQGLGGMSNIYGIPGSVGGAVSGNAGAYGNSISDFVEEVNVYSPKEDKIYKFSYDKMKFAYRESIVKHTDFIVLSAKFKLKSVSPSEEKNKIRNVIVKRKSSQPYGEKSLGSIFKRKEDIPISKLIDNVGLKGFSVGDAQISKKHAGFIINKGNAKASDVLELVDIAKNKVYERYGINPELEIEVLNGD